MIGLILKVILEILMVPANFFSFDKNAKKKTKLKQNTSQDEEVK